LQLTAARTGLYERTFYRNLSYFLKPGMVALDIGSHLGIYAEEIQRLVGPQGTVVAIEPLPLLSAIISEQCSKTIQVHTCALSDRTETKTMWIPLIDAIYPEPALASLTPPDTAAMKVETQVFSAGDFLKPFSKLDFIKLDAEGGECDILKSAASTLSTLRPIIQVEVSRNDIRADQIETHFGLHDYRAYSGHRTPIEASAPLPHMCYLIPFERAIC
jgi:FkbM family methyltransferase